MNVRGMAFSGGFSTQMTEQEARLILGLNPQKPLDKAAINAAFVKIISTNHPDQGGSPYMAKKIIEAKEHLNSLTD